MAAPSGTGALQHGSCRYGGVSASQGHLLTVKGHMLASMDAAVESERNAGTSRLAAKQAEVDILKGELHDIQQQLSRTDRHLDRLCAAYAEKQEAVLDTRAQLRAWYVWRGHIARQRRLARQAMQAEHYYVKRWLLGRAWDRWAGRARSRYRQLVIQRAEQQHEEDAAALTATHALEVAALRAEVEALQEQLQQEAAARNRMEEDMKRAFMRGVTAINLEAVQMMRRGAPPSGTNPFPVTVPLNAGTAASGLAAAQQQHMQQLAGPLQQQALWQDGAACDGGRDICSTAAGLPQQQQQSCNGGLRVVIERGPAAGGGSRATGQPRHVAGGHAAAGGSKAKTAIDRREEGERAKQQEDEQKEEARKAKIKQMFERL
ncbi:hypothetical protein COO60DRAFT_1701259 [Scenedesmus sp. NREL 46B-D3]|nr:hypothetical protein COO60DRAFT_1701259 [Scenedesmus sp. NREL 46B-D3]